MLNKNTFLFLENLASNNNREWFMLHKAEYEAAKLDVVNLAASLIPEIASRDLKFDKDIAPHKCVLRIYRDVRFSKNKAPYKTNFAIWLPSSTNKSLGSPGYYLHIEPNKCFFAGGYWMPSPEHLKLIRQEIDYNGGDFEKVLNSNDFKRTFTFGHGEKLKNAPKGYELDNPRIELLKLKSFEAIEQIDGKHFLKADIIARLRNSIGIICPFVVYLRNAIQ